VCVWSVTDLIFLCVVISMRFFLICTVVGFGILAPLNFTDTYLADNPSEKEEHSYGTLEKLTILNISYGSMRYEYCDQSWVMCFFL
jgi:hypothetical protein